MRSCCATLLGLLAPLLWFRSAFAAEMPKLCNPPTYGQKLATRYSRNASGAYTCLAGTKVENEVLRIRATFYQQSSSTKKYAAIAQHDAASLLSTWPLQANLQLSAIRNDARIALQGDESREFNNFSDVFFSSLDTLVAKSSEITTIRDWSAKEAVVPAFLPGYWKVTPEIGPNPGSLPAKYLKEKRCLDETRTNACDVAYKKATDMSDAIFLVDEVVGIMASSSRTDLVNQAALRVKKWHAYLYDTQFQYWWELALNRYIEVRCPALMKWECARPKEDKYGNQIGFRAAPSHKLIFLHPDVGLEYLHHEPAGQRFKPAIVFQWVGLQKWNWSDGRVSALRGIAIVTTLADTSRTKPFGFGLQFQWKKYSIAVTSHGGDIGITISLGVINWLGTVNQSWARNLEKPLPK